MDWQPLMLTFELALATTAILLVLGIPLAYWLARTTSMAKPFLETLVAMPLVLPPTVLGFYLLMAFSPAHGPGQWLLEHLNLKLVFSFPGLVLASIIYSLPFMVQPIQSGFAHFPKAMEEASHCMGKSKWTTLFYVTLPNIKPAVITGVVLSFAHTLGEFGVVLMIGGNIPGKTKVASIAIYDEVEAMNYGMANTYSLILLGISFLVLLTVYSWNRNYFKGISG